MSDEEAKKQDAETAKSGGGDPVGDPSIPPLPLPDDVEAEEDV